MAEDEPIKLYGYAFGKFRLYPGPRRFFDEDREVELGTTLFNILQVLVENACKTVSKRDLAVGALCRINIDSTILSTYVGQGRKLLGAPAIRTVVNQGYVMTLPTTPLTKPPPPEGGPPAGPVINLPPRLATMIGRDVDLAALETSVKRGRLTALIGPGGVGKTQLAIEFGWRAGESFPDGVVLVSAAPLTDAVALASAVATALDIPLYEGGIPVSTIGAAIRGRQMLMVIDGCEHLHEVVAELAQQLLAAAPHLSLLLTSQQVLNSGEQIYRLDGLAVPPGSLKRADEIKDYSAVEFFVKCIERAGLPFQLSDDNAATVAEICRRFDGLPLSLQMAAPLVRTLGVDGLLKWQGDRLRLLRLERTDRRHESLRAVVEWSCSMLSAAEQRFFRALGVFPEWFSAEEAIAVVGGDPVAVVDLLVRLENASLLVVDNRRERPFRLLETLRLYAREKLKESGESDPIFERLARYLTDLFVEAEAAWETALDQAWRPVYLPLIDNVRVTLDWTLAAPERAPLGIALFGAAARLFSMLSLVPESHPYCDKFVALIGPETLPADAARLLKYSAKLHRDIDRLRSTAMLERSAALYRQAEDRLNLASVLGTLGGDLIYFGRHTEAKAVLDEAREILSGSYRIKSLYTAMTYLGALASATNDTTEAVYCLEEARDLAQALRDPLRENIALYNLGEVECRRGAFDRAADCAQAAATGLREAGESAYLLEALINLAQYLIFRGDHAEARRHAEEAWPLVVERRGRWFRIAVQTWALLAARSGLYREAAQLIGWATSDYIRAGEVREPTEQETYDRLMNLLAEHFSPQELAALTSDGGRWNAARIVDFVTRRIISPNSSAV
jgi:predicted ATPase